MHSEHSEESDSMEDMKRVLGTLYARKQFVDFRKPVVLMYPNLVRDYYAVIPEPSDLGTLLLDAFRGGTSVEELHRRMRLVHKNCALYNEGMPSILSVGQHLQIFSAGLYEELIDKPYDQEKLQPMKFSPTEWVMEKLLRRKRRYQFVKSALLSGSELRHMLLAFNDLPEPVPARLEALIAQKIAILTELLYASKDTDQGMVQSTCMEQLLEDVMVCCRNRGLEEPSLYPLSTEDLLTSHLMFGEGDWTIHSDCAKCIHYLHQAMGFIAVVIEERITRGVFYSSVWARPSQQVIWAQPQPLTKDKRHQSLWYPAMILASKSDNIEWTRMDPELMQRNLMRMPTAIMTQLLKLRPRTGSFSSHAAEKSEKAAISKSINSYKSGDSDASELVKLVPEGFLLVEFFGSHDFGWIKGEQAVQFKPDSTLGEDGKLTATAPSSKVCCLTTVEETIDAVLWAEEKNRCHWEVGSEDADCPLPTEADLEDLVRCPDHLLPPPPPPYHYDPTAELAGGSGGMNGGSDMTAIVRAKNISGSGDNGSGDLAAGNNQAHTSAPTVDKPPAQKRKRAPPGQGRRRKKQDEDGDESAVVTTATQGPIPVLPGGVVDFNQCIQNGIFRVTLCGLPSGLDKVSGGEKKNRALIRTAGVVHWMDKMRSLHLPVSKAIETTHTAALRSTLASASQTSSAAGNSTNTTTTSGGGLKSEPYHGPRDPRLNARSSGDVPEKKGPGRGNWGKRGDKVDGSSLDSLSTLHGGQSRSSSNAHVSVQVTAAGAAATFVLNSDKGCSKYHSGEGTVYTRDVDLDSAIFFGESRSRDSRKEVLRQELATIKLQLEALQALATKRSEENAVSSSSSDNNNNTNNNNNNNNNNNISRNSSSGSSSSGSDSSSSSDSSNSEIGIGSSDGSSVGSSSGTTANSSSGAVGITMLGDEDEARPMKRKKPVPNQTGDSGDGNRNLGMLPSPPAHLLAGGGGTMLSVGLLGQTAGGKGLLGSAAGQPPIPPNRSTAGAVPISTPLNFTDMLPF